MAEGSLSKCVQFFDERVFLVGQVETSRVGGLFRLGRVGRPRTLICHSVSQFPYPVLPHTVLGEGVVVGFFPRIHSAVNTCFIL